VAPVDLRVAVGVAAPGRERAHRELDPGAGLARPTVMTQRVSPHAERQGTAISAVWTVAGRPGKAPPAADPATLCAHCETPCIH
jgi:hypothetical protein